MVDHKHNSVSSDDRALCWPSYSAIARRQSSNLNLQFPRTENAVKNHWYCSILKHRGRDGCTPAPAKTGSLARWPRCDEAAAIRAKRRVDQQSSAAVEAEGYAACNSRKRKLSGTNPQIRARCGCCDAPCSFSFRRRPRRWPGIIFLCLAQLHGSV
jgi:hypothetical protein